MSQIETAKLTLTPETREFLDQRVASGDYANEQELISVALENLRADADDLSAWEQQVFQPAYLRYQSNPEQVFTLEQVEVSLENARSGRRRAS